MKFRYILQKLELRLGKRFRRLRKAKAYRKNNDAMNRMRKRLLSRYRVVMMLNGIFYVQKRKGLRFVNMTSYKTREDAICDVSDRVDVGMKNWTETYKTQVVWAGKQNEEGT